MEDTLGSLHLLVLAALVIGVDCADEIAARLGLDTDDVAVLLSDLERLGAITAEDGR